MTPPGNGSKKILHFNHPPQRVVSLVPSLTESLFDLGLGGVLVGITDYCVYPAEALQGLPRLGGTKNPRVADILTLEPELVLANQEENTRQVVEALEAAGVQVWVTFPQTIRQSLDVLWTLVGLYLDRTAAVRLETLEMTIEWMESSLEVRSLQRYFCPIWQGQLSGGHDDEADRFWWMTFNRHTYANDLLRVMGGQNVFVDRERRYPLSADLSQDNLPTQEKSGDDAESRDTRYPRVTLDEIRAVNPELILLPNEPYLFTDQDCQLIYKLLPDTLAIQKDRVLLVEGSLITWHGTRLARALEQLPPLFTI